MCTRSFPRSQKQKEQFFGMVSTHQPSAAMRARSASMTPRRSVLGSSAWYSTARLKRSRMTSQRGSFTELRESVSPRRLLAMLQSMPQTVATTASPSCVYCMAASATSRPGSGWARKGRDRLNASGCSPFSICFHVTGAAIGKPGRARGEYVPTAVVPRPLRK
jgi:hypothetical protein